MISSSSAHFRLQPIESTIAHTPTLAVIAPPSRERERDKE